MFVKENPDKKKYPKENNKKKTNNNNKQEKTNKQTEKQENRIKSITITTTNTQTYTKSQARCSLNHSLHRRYCMAITQMISTRKCTSHPLPYGLPKVITE